MIKSIMKTNINSSKKELFEIITNNKEYSWRSDISKIETIDDNKFIEYSKNKFKTYFTITLKKEFDEYKFDLENSNLKGKWTGIFKEISKDITELTLIEELKVNRYIMKLLAKPYLKRQQKRYIKDLTNYIDNK